MAGSINKVIGDRLLVRALCLGLLMTRALAPILLAGPALAQTPEGIMSYGPRAMMLPGDDACEERIAVYNISGRYTGVETLRSDRGDVLVRYETVGNHAPGNDDIVEVVGLPEGLHAEPMMAEVVDGEMLVICLFEWEGL